MPGEQRSEPSVGEAEPSAQIVERRSRLRRSYAELEPHRHVTTRCCCYVHRGMLLRTYRPHTRNNRSVLLRTQRPVVTYTNTCCYVGRGAVVTYIQTTHT